MDVVPGRYTTLWFEATKPGRYHVFCAEYCGLNHSGMIGWIEVMEPPDYQAWLAGGAQGGSLAEAGEKLFQSLACANCHRSDAAGKGPALDDLFGSVVQLQGGQTVTADAEYIRESILNPQAKIVTGFPKPQMPASMPTFQGLVTEEQLLQLIEYIKSLKTRQGTSAPATSQPSGQQATPQTAAPKAGAGKPQ